MQPKPASHTPQTPPSTYDVFMGIHHRPVVCPRCGEHESHRYRWRQFANGTYHIATYCRCRRFLGWAPQTAENVSLADATIDATA